MQTQETKYIESWTLATIFARQNIDPGNDLSIAEVYVRETLLLVKKTGSLFFLSQVGKFINERGSSQERTPAEREEWFLATRLAVVAAQLGLTVLEAHI